MNDRSMVTSQRGIGRRGMRLRGMRRLAPAILGAALCGTALLGSGLLLADDGIGPDGKLSPGVPVVHPSAVKKSTEKLLAEIEWQRDLEAALAVAKDQGKPLFWLQMVGNLDDGL